MFTVKTLIKVLEFHLCDALRSYVISRKLSVKSLTLAEQLYKGYVAGILFVVILPLSLRILPETDVSSSVMHSPQPPLSLLGENGRGRDVGAYKVGWSDEQAEQGLLCTASTSILSNMNTSHSAQIAHLQVSSTHSLSDSLCLVVLIPTSKLGCPL